MHRNQKQRLSQLFNLLGITGKEERRELAKQFVIQHNIVDYNLTGSSEATNLIAYLEDRLAAQKAASADPCNTMRRKVIGLLCSWQPKRFKDQEGKAVMMEVYMYVKHKGYLKPKGLNAYTAQELPTLVSQFENIVKSYPNNPKDQQ